MSSEAPKNRPDISPTAFWDVDFEHLDFEIKSRFVIEKVLNYGLWADITALFHYYGFERVKAEVLEIAYLKKKTLSFCCVIFDLKPEQFRCYTRQQSSPAPWNY
ncbi:DUF6922 domain-containing protein [Larkinella humicola]|uniref:DUF6922 domain-containing protein n=1 Tax=Larkinella humicola TaxID=2607654 RepID=A0A5N1JQU0_9BACT|nr:hypothetical protein [Larkinella humicola]KAA9356682.1 hypothetical protein F0P93_02730 [Larkinella humicola]